MEAGSKVRSRSLTVGSLLTFHFSLLTFLPSLAVDLFQQHVDGGGAASGVCAGPALRPQAFANLALDTLTEFQHRPIDSCRPGAFGHRISCAEDARRPCVIALENRSRRERGQRVDEPESIVRVRAALEALPHERDGFIRFPSANRQDGANIQRLIEEPGTRVTEDSGGFIQKPFTLLDGAGC